jgi:hypothetical protein
MKYYTQRDHKKSPFLSNYFVFDGVRVVNFFFLCSMFCFFCLRLVSCASDVASVSRLSILDYLSGSAGSFYWWKRMTSLTSPRPLGHDSQSYNSTMFYSRCKGTKNREPLINNKNKRLSVACIAHLGIITTSVNKTW